MEDCSFIYKTEVQHSTWDTAVEFVVNIAVTIEHRHK